MLDRSTPRPTALTEPAHEARIEQDLARAATGIASELGDGLSALWLVGPFARGEGGIVSDRGELTAYPGYELIAVLRRKPARHVPALRSLGGAWSRLLGTRVSIAGIGARTVPHLPPTRFWLEAQNGGLRTLAGDTALVRQIPELDPTRLATKEAFALIASAFTAVALGELEQVSARSKTERLHAAALAVGDGVLLRNGHLQSTWRDRLAELEHGRGAGELASLYRNAMAFFARPDRWTPTGVDVPTWLEQGKRSLAHAYLSLEAARIQAPMHVFGYLRHPDSITAEASAHPSRAAEPLTLARRARLLAMRVPALAALATDPFDRLVRASVALAFAADAPACRTHVAAYLGIRTAFGAAGDDELAKALRSLASELLVDPIRAPFAGLSFDPPPPNP
jgi:hypothetical protein